MKFGRLPIAAGEGAILAHAIRAAGLSFKKGDVMTAREVALLEEAGVLTIVGAKLEPGDVGENEAASRLAEAIAGDNIRLEDPFTGRCNILATRPGLVSVNVSAVDALNSVDEAITVATLPPMQPVVADEMIATVKIIPFSVPQTALDLAIRAGGVSAVSIAPFRPLRVGVVSTLLPALKPSVVRKTVDALARRLSVADAKIVRELSVAHDVAALSEVLRDMSDVDLVVVFGASAITDRRDVVPAAIISAGGVLDRLGMPVDPGNLLLLARLPVDGRRIPVIGAPGCARSPKVNGFDFVLWRLLADQQVMGRELAGMGVGGLLSEIVSRPQLRRPGIV